jgi:hypothetical protein
MSNMPKANSGEEADPRLETNSNALDKASFGQFPSKDLVSSHGRLHSSKRRALGWAEADFAGREGVRNASVM